MSLTPSLVLTAGQDYGNARFLAAASYLTYVLDSAALVRQFDQYLGLRGDAVGGLSELQAFVGATDEDVVVAFRGTLDPRTLNGVRDWLINADFYLTVPAAMPPSFGADFTVLGGGAQLHNGFARALASLWDGDGGVFDLVTRAQNAKRRRLWLTGHSLGGALATLAAWRFFHHDLDVHQIYTYGAPMVGNAAAAAGLNAQFGDSLFRFAAPDDPVPLLPVSGWPNQYIHAGRTEWPPARGAAAAALGLASVAAFIDDMSRTAARLVADAKAKFTAIFWDGIQRHIQAHYLELSYIPAIETQIVPPATSWADYLNQHPLAAAARVAPPVQAAAALAEAIASPPAPSAAAPSVSPDMDPRLQRLVLRRKHGVPRRATASTQPDEISVLALVTDLAAWKSLSEVRPGVVIAGPEGAPTLVSARIPIGRVEAVRRQPFVKSLKAAAPLRPSLAATIQETGARADLLPANCRADGGKGAIVGLVDFGFDFAHRHFQSAGGGTRLLALWDQGGPSNPDSPFGYGKVYRPAEINAALGKSDPYASLGYGPPPDSVFGPKGTHGTHTADIAAGNGYNPGGGAPANPPGVAPAADLIFVEVAADDVPDAGPAVATTSFGDSVHLLEAIRFIFDQAGDRPCVVNVSLGTNGGPHDGSTLVEQGIDRLVREKSNRAVVIAAANAYDDGIHAAGSPAFQGQIDLAWQVPPNRARQSEMQVWYPRADRLTVEVLAPDGNSLMTVAPGANQDAQLAGEVVLFVANRLDDPNNHDNLIGIFLEKDMPAGTWTIRLRNSNADARTASFHAWIERDDQAQSRFGGILDNSHTIGSISCGRESIAVGSYDAHKDNLPISFFSNAGPTRDARQKPEVSAPGHAVWAAWSRTSTGVVQKSGTSMAAPAVAGLVALMLADAHARGVSLDSTAIRALLIGGTRRDPPPGIAWDARYGFGRAHAVFVPTPAPPAGDPAPAPPAGGPAPPAPMPDEGTVHADDDASPPPGRPRSRRPPHNRGAGGSPA